MKKLIRLLAVFTLVLLLVASLSSIVLAIANPTSGPAIERIDVYRHCLEGDDMLVIVQYYLDYTVNPSETIAEAYLGRYMDGATELMSVAPYAYYDDGYDHGIFSFYFGAADAPAWAGTYTARFEGNPTLGWPGAPPETSSNSLNKHETETVSATQLILSADVLSIAIALSGYWSPVTLTQETASGLRLSSYGEQYFGTAISNLREMCPNIFIATVTAPEYEEETFGEWSYGDILIRRDYVADSLLLIGRSGVSDSDLLIAMSTTISLSYAGELLDVWAGTGVDVLFQNLSDWTTIPLTVIKSFLWLVVVMMIAYFAARATGDLRPALFLALLTLPMGNLLGMLSLTVTMVAALFCVLALAYALFYQKASG